MSPFRLSRRAMLRGVGVGIALPLLDAMLDSRGLLLGTSAAEPLGTPPLRLFTFFFPNGCDKANWHPKETGPNYTLTDSLQPLAARKGDITVVSGMNLFINTGEGDDHARGTGCFATAAPLTKTASTGTSVDQVAHEELGQGQSPLVLAIQNKPTGSFGNVDNVGNIYGEISWSQSRGGVVQAQRNPLDVFQAFCGAKPMSNAEKNRANLYEQSKLSYVKDSTKSLQEKLGTADRQRLEAHLTAIREVERSLTTTSKQIDCTTTTSPPEAEGPYSDNYSTKKAQQMMDLLALAISSDYARYGSFMLGNGSNTEGCANKDIANAELQEHSAAHDKGGDVKRYDQIRIYKRYQMTQLAYLLDKLDAIKEPNGTALDNSAIFVGSELADPVNHTHDNLPILVCGKAGGRITSAGSCINVNGRQVGDLLLTLLRAVGSKATQIGNSTGTISEMLSGV